MGRFHGVPWGSMGFHGEFAGSHERGSLCSQFQECLIDEVGVAFELGLE